MFTYNKNTGLKKIEKSLSGVQLDVVSDLHLEFYYKKIQFGDNLELFINNIVNKMKEDLESKRYEVLIVAGDISSRNSISIAFLEQVSKIWKHVLVIPGNHDLQDKRRTVERYSELITQCTSENIVFLMDEEEIFEYNGVSIGGTFMAYNLHSIEDYTKWKRTLSDSQDLSREFINERNNADIEYYYNVIDKVDVFVSHIPIVNLDGSGATPNLFLNVDVNPKENVLYISGHTHYPANSVDKYSNGCSAINVSYGYPEETEDGRKIIQSVIITK